MLLELSLRIEGNVYIVDCRIIYALVPWALGRKWVALPTFNRAIAWCFVDRVFGLYWHHVLF